MNLNPNLKRSASQLELVRRWLNRGKSITPGVALKKWGCARLGARIQQLRDEKVPVMSTLVVVPTQRGVARVACYWLDGVGQPPRQKGVTRRRRDAEKGRKAA
jgi:hypothetical protein